MVSLSFPAITLPSVAPPRYGGKRAVCGIIKRDVDVPREVEDPPRHCGVGLASGICMSTRAVKAYRA